MVAVVPEGSERALGFLEKRGWTGTEWSFILLAKAEGAKAAKDGVFASLSTLGIIDALLLSFAFPLIFNPPSILLNDDDMEAYLRSWYWLVFLSVLFAVISLVLIVLVLGYISAVPDDGMVSFLARHHVTYSICCLGFILCIICECSALVVVTRSYMQDRDLYPALALMAFMLSTLVITFLVFDHVEHTSNVRTFKERTLKAKEEPRPAVAL